jgi:lipoate-protein ligase A
MTVEIPNAQAPETKEPTLEELQKTRKDYITMLRDRMDDLKVQVEYQELKARLAKATAEEMEAMTFITRMNTEPKTEEIELTQEMYDSHPQLKDSEYKVGDILIIQGNNILGKK